MIKEKDMTCENGIKINFRSVSFVVTLLILAGSFVGGYNTTQYRIARAEERIETVENNANGYVKGIQSDMKILSKDVSILQKDTGMLQRDVNSIKESMDYMRNRIDSLIDKLTRGMGG